MSLAKVGRPTFYIAKEPLHAQIRAIPRVEDVAFHSHSSTHSDQEHNSIPRRQCHEALPEPLQIKLVIRKFAAFGHENGAAGHGSQEPSGARPVLNALADRFVLVHFTRVVVQMAVGDSLSKHANPVTGGVRREDEDMPVVKRTP